MKQPGWQQGFAAAALLACSGNASSQSVDTATARAVIDQPLAMSVQVRGFDWPASRMTPECLHIEIQQGESGDTITPLRLRTIPSGDDGRVVVQISSPQRVTDTVLTGRLRLLCGADYTREFTVLADPPTSSTLPARPSTTPPAVRVTPHGEAKRNPARPPVAAVQVARHITRSDDVAAPAAGPPDRQTPEDAAMQRLVAAVLSALPQAAPVAGDLVKPLPALQAPVADAATAHPTGESGWQALQDLQEEQRQTRTAMAALLARIERSEHHGNPWRDVSLIAGGILGLWTGLLLLRLVREGLMPRLSTPTHATAASVAHRLRRQRARMTPDEDFLAPRDARDTGRTPTASTPDPGTVHWMPPVCADQPTAHEAPPATRWPDADFGHPSLDTTVASTDLLRELAPSVSESPVGVALVLEQRLQELPGKCPWILLHLLELYRQMAQPWNHERVAAQLEALYNVRIASMAAEESRGEADLEDCPDALDRVLQAWSQEDPAPALARLLLRTTGIEALDKPVFEDVLLLHGIVQQRQSPWLSAVDCRVGNLSAHFQPLSTPSPPDSDRSTELLAA